jgi:outer membrane protein
MLYFVGEKTVFVLRKSKLIFVSKENLKLYCWMTIMKWLKFTFFFVTLYTVSANVFAVDLMEVYRQALTSDPKFKAARSSWLADREILAINRADLLPQLSIVGNLTRNSGVGENNYHNNNAIYSLRLRQSIFDFGNLVKLSYSKAMVKRAEVTFLVAEEELLQRVSQAYFNVLLAKDILSFAKINKDSIDRLLIQAKHKYDVGLVAIVDLEDARKNYAMAAAEKVTALNNLNNRLEQLAEITGVKYTKISSLKLNFPLLAPEPSDVEQWVEVAKKQNLNFALSRYNTIVARENVKMKNADHIPSIIATGNYTSLHSNGNNFIDNNAGNNKSLGVGVELAVPVFQGGRVLASAKQADYQYQARLAEQEKSYRSLVSETRQTYFGILSSISKIKADKQMIKSSQSSLHTIEANYNVGQCTVVDVLLARAQLFDAQKNLACDVYSYIIQFIKLKSLTGMLSVSDLEQINLRLEARSDTRTKSERTVKSNEEFRKSINNSITKDTKKPVAAINKF